MQVKPLEPFGVEAAGVNVTAASEGELHEFRKLACRHGVLVIRDQQIDDSQFQRFLSEFGPLTFTKGMAAVPDYPGLNLVSNVGRKKKPRSVFHTDTSYVRCPPSFTALRAVTIPEGGGETLFTDQYLAYERLSDEIRERFATATVLHQATGVTLDSDDESESWHPLFRRHPDTGRTTLFLSTPERCIAIKGSAYPSDESSAENWIEQFFEHSIEETHLLRHHWKDGDLVVWDNRCTLHRADHSQVRGNRVLHRAIVEGEEPIMA
ncbi:MAG: TauD/TfdA family dioxygenase [Verrucomicrobiota bacterium]